MKPRTTQQNRAFHLWLRLVVDKLSSAGIGVREFYKPGVEIPMTEHILKESMRPVMQKMFGKMSTTELTTQEIDNLYNVLNIALAENHGIHVPFPSEEHIAYEYTKIS